LGHLESGRKAGRPAKAAGVIVGAMLAAALVALPALAEDAPPRPVAPQHWIRTPAAADFWKYYPSKAKDQGIQGRVVVRCVVGDDGQMTDCVVVEERPPGYGFGDATLKVVAMFKKTPTPHGPDAKPETVTIPISWRLG
jgi:TonB family protein